IFIEDVVIPRNEESHNLNNLMRFLVPRNDKLYVFFIPVNLNFKWYNLYSNSQFKELITSKTLK
ncbi:hypothetical protein ACLH3U_002503, partial [Flavobacterium psychrophilum]